VLTCQARETRQSDRLQRKFNAVDVQLARQEKCGRKGVGVCTSPVTWELLTFPLLDNHIYRETTTGTLLPGRHSRDVRTDGDYSQKYKVCVKPSLSPP